MEHLKNSFWLKISSSGAFPVASGGTHGSVNFDSPKEKSPHLVGFPYHAMWLNLRASKSLLPVCLSWVAWKPRVNSGSLLGVAVIFWFAPIFSCYTNKEGGDSSEFLPQLFCCCLQSTCRDRIKWKHPISWTHSHKGFSPNSLEENNDRKTINVNGNRKLQGSRIILWCKMSPFTSTYKTGYWSTYRTRGN